MNKTTILIASLLIAMLVCTQNVFSSDSMQKNSSTGIVIGSVIGTAAIGSAAFFLIRHNKRDKVHGDSLIHFVNQSIDSSNYYYAIDNYFGSGEKLQKVLPKWEEYSKYCNKRHKSKKISKDSVFRKIADCNLLQSLSHRLSQIDTLVFSLPGSTDELAIENRHAILALKKNIGEDIRLLEEEHKENKEIIRYGLRKSLRHLKNIDSLFSVIYTSEQQNFNLKCKYFYKRALEAKDTFAIRHFVDDCDYYHEEKEWCERARQKLDSTLNPQNIILSNIQETNKPKGQPFKFSPQDSMNNDFKLAMESKNATLLQNYISRYAKRKFKKTEIKIDTIQKVLSVVLMDQRKDNAYNKAFPLFSNGNASDLKIVINGITDQYSDLFKNTFDSLRGELKGAQGIRFPASVVIENKVDKFQFFLVAHVNPEKDVVVHSDKDTLIYSFTGCLWGVKYLDKLKSHLVNVIRTQSDIDVSLKESYIKKLNSSIYIVRLKKNESDNITMYAYGLYNNSTDQQFKFYNFFDISSGTQRDLRIINRASYEIRSLNASQGDSFKNGLLKSYFHK